MTTPPARDVDRLECLEVVYPFPVPVTFAGEALVNVERASILDHDVDVHLPVIDGSRTAVRRPQYLDGGWKPEAQYWDGSGEQEEDEPDSPWGFVARLGTARTALHDVSVKRVLLRFDPMTSSEAESLLKALAGALPVWFDVLKDNCEVLTRQDLDVLSPRRRVEVSGSDWRARWGYDELTPPQRIWVDLHDDTAVTPGCWKEILRCAGRGTRPLPEALLIRDARAALARKQYRRAVIDAGTSTDMSLHDLFTQWCRQTPGGPADELRRLASRWTMGQMRDFLKKIGVQYGTLTKTTIDIRNQAAHNANVAPTQAEAELMLEAAITALTHARPGWDQVEARS